jgi:hypothetical protein
MRTRMRAAMAVIAFAVHGEIACERRAFALAHLFQRIERRVDDRQQRLARLGDAPSSRARCGTRPAGARCRRA